MINRFFLVLSLFVFLISCSCATCPKPGARIISEHGQWKKISDQPIPYFIGNQKERKKVQFLGKHQDKILLRVWETEFTTYYGRLIELSENNGIYCSEIIESWPRKNGCIGYRFLLKNEGDIIFITLEKIKT